MIVNLVHLLRQQIRWSEETFGPGQRTEGVLDHIRSELDEIEEAPEDLEEWIDVVILAFDGAWRAGHNPDEIVQALNDKYEKNFGRMWPDWRTAPEGQRIEHVKDGA